MSDVDDALALLAELERLQAEERRRPFLEALRMMPDDVVLVTHAHGQDGRDYGRKVLRPRQPRPPLARRWVHRVEPGRDSVEWLEPRLVDQLLQIIGAGGSFEFVWAGEEPS